VRPGYELRGNAQPAEVTSAWMRFRVPVKPKETTTLVVEEAKPLENTYMLTNVTSDQVVLFAREHSINKTIEEALRKILAQKKVIEDLEGQKSARESEAERIFDDQQRLRENLKVLKGSQEEKALVQRYTQQLNNQESRLEALQKESERLDAKVESEQAELDRMIRRSPSTSSCSVQANIR
jgi:septal ring factor EnvC (AmiA/AmiB activator)